MRSATFTDRAGRLVGFVEPLSYPKSQSKRVDYAILTVSELLPFKVRFTTIGISGYDSKNPPPIGVAVIGINNYIL
jgi:hypothetical protein